MKVSKLTERKLQETEYKNCLNEMIDFCLYESCLNEETAKDYFKFLINDGLSKIDWKNKNAYEQNEEIDAVSFDRFNKEKKRLTADKDKYNEEGYFESKSFAEFRNDFKKLLKNKKNDKSLTKDEIGNILLMFDLYCSRFSQNLDKLQTKQGVILPTFRNEAKWVDMKHDEKIKQTTML